MKFTAKPESESRHIPQSTESVIYLAKVLSIFQLCEWAEGKLWKKFSKD